MNRREYFKKYYAEHREAILARRRAWNEANKDKLRAKDRRYYVKHKLKKNEDNN